MLLLLQFLTNVFFIPYLALRQFDGSKPNNAKSGVEPSKLPPYAAVLGVTGAVVGVVSLFWAPLARPEYGGLADRLTAHHPLCYPGWYHVLMLATPPTCFSWLISFVPLATQVAVLPRGIFPQPCILRVCVGRGVVYCVPGGLDGKCACYLPFYPILWTSRMACAAFFDH